MFTFDPKVTSTFVGYFFVPGYVFGHAESIGTFFMNIFSRSKNRIFSSGGGGGGG